MLPPEPALLSTMNCWPVSSESWLQTMRESVSVGPPGGKTLMYFTGLVGHASAARARPDARNGVARTNARRLRVNLPMISCAPCVSLSLRRRIAQMLQLALSDPHALVLLHGLGAAFDGILGDLLGRCVLGIGNGRFGRARGLGLNSDHVVPTGDDPPCSGSLCFRP